MFHLKDHQTNANLKKKEKTKAVSIYEVEDLVEERSQGR